MKNKFPCIISLLILAFVICLGCGILYVTARLYTTSSESKPRCSPRVGTFPEANLVGTWVAGSPEHMDTLIIRANGTYRQVIHVALAEGSPIDYQGDWQPWHLEYSKDNIPYLHLTGMRFCGMNPDISCDKRDGDGYDFCQDKSLPMNGEGILIVLETSDGHYYLHYPLGSENSWVYRFQGP